MFKRDRLAKKFGIRYTLLTEFHPWRLHWMPCRCDDENGDLLLCQILNDAHALGKRVSIKSPDYVEDYWKRFGFEYVRYEHGHGRSEGGYVIMHSSGRIPSPHGPRVSSRELERQEAEHQLRSYRR